MKKSIFFILLILLPVFYSFSSDVPTVKQIQGKVEIKNSQSGWVKAEKGMKVSPGALISTGFRSNAVIELDNSELYIKQLTRMSIENLSRKQNTVNTKLNLQLGRIKADVKSSKGLKHDFIVRTPVSTAAVRGTIFESGVRFLGVDSGKIKYSNKIGQKVTVAGGSSSYISPSGVNPPISAADTMNNTFNVEPSTSPYNSIQNNNSGDTGTTASGESQGTFTINASYSGS